MRPGRVCALRGLGSGVLYYSLADPRMPLILRVLAGAAGGALFGVAFGALASVFHGGPTLAVGVGESWAWFR